MRNRWNIEVKQGYSVTYVNPRGDVRKAIVLKLYRMSGYGWRVQTAWGSCGIDDVTKSEPVDRFSIYIKYGKEREFRGGFLSHKDKTEWSYRTAKKHLKDCENKKRTGKGFADVWHFSIVEA